MYEHHQVKKEYTVAAKKHNEEYKKVMWASEQSMLNRFSLAISMLDFSNAKSWLDVGCGTGELQRQVLEKNPKIDAMAIDICDELICFAKDKLQNYKINLSLIDFMNIEEKNFDIITCIGVLQKTSFTPKQFFQKCFDILKPEGKIFLDTKNINWEGYSEKEQPDATHISFNIEELWKEATSAGLNILKIEGFLPTENKIVMTNESRTIFMICEKPKW